MPKDENSIIQSVDRALTLLNEIASTPGQPRNLTELSGIMGIDRSSVFRLLTTLARHGLIRQNANDKSYSLGYGIYGLASSLRVQEKITDLVNPYLKQIVKETGENAHLAVSAGNRCVFIDREQGTRTLTANTNIGDTEELYCTAVGKSLICNLDRKELEERLAGEPLTAYTANTITDMDALFEELKTVRETGAAVDNEEYEPNVFCMAAPIYNFESKIEAAVGLSGPKVRLKPREKEIRKLLKSISGEISATLGYRPAAAE